MNVAMCRVGGCKGQRAVLLNMDKGCDLAVAQQLIGSEVSSRSRGCYWEHCDLQQKKSRVVDHCTGNCTQWNLLYRDP